MPNFLFYVLSFLIIVSGLLAVTSRTIFSSAFFTFLSLSFLSVIFLILGHLFLAFLSFTIWSILILTIILFSPRLSAIKFPVPKVSRKQHFFSVLLVVGFLLYALLTFMKKTIWNKLEPEKLELTDFSWAVYLVDLYPLLILVSLLGLLITLLGLKSLKKT